LYYYFVTFARALDAWGEEKIEVVGANGEMETRDWANDLIDRLSELQKEDGSFENVHDRWMEGDPVLVTAYALIALRAARD
jgi:squalene-hopene/tetraprenyl-beta-curcumene cyclase